MSSQPTLLMSAFGGIVGCASFSKSGGVWDKYLKSSLVQIYRFPENCFIPEVSPIILAALHPTICKRSVALETNVYI